MCVPDAQSELFLGLRFWRQWVVGCRPSSDDRPGFRRQQVRNVKSQDLAPDTGLNVHASDVTGLLFSIQKIFCNWVTSSWVVGEGIFISRFREQVSQLSGLLSDM